MTEASAGGEELQLRRFLMPGLFVLALFVVLWMRRPAPEVPHWRFSGNAFGTLFAVQVLPDAQGEDREGQEKLAQAISACIDRVNAHMSTYQADSELSKLNASPSLLKSKLSEDLSVVLGEALRINALSGGAFDVTIGPVVNAWGFGPDIVKPPTEETLRSAKAKTGSSKLTLNQEGLWLTRAQAGLYIDLSAIAKGYAVDLIGEAMEQAGHTNYLVEVGGEVRARGLKGNGQPWSVGIEQPDGGQQDVAESLSLRDLSIATSGNYRNLRTLDGKTVTHIIDARTGQPVSHALGSVSVLHPSCMSADALATALYVLGVKEGLALAERENIAALFLSPANGATPSSRQASSAFTRLNNVKADSQ